MTLILSMSLNFILSWKNDKWYNKRVLIWRFTLVLIKIDYGQIGDQKGSFIQQTQIIMGLRIVYPWYIKSSRRQSKVVVDVEFRWQLTSNESPAGSGWSCNCRFLLPISTFTTFFSIHTSRYLYDSLIYIYMCNWCLTPLRFVLCWDVLNTTFCYKVCVWLSSGLWFSPHTLETNKTDF